MAASVACRPAPSCRDHWQGDSLAFTCVLDREAYAPVWVSVNDPDYDPNAAGGGTPGDPPVGDPQPLPDPPSYVTVSPGEMAVEVNAVTSQYSAWAHYGGSDSVDVSGVADWGVAAGGSGIASRDDQRTFLGVSLGTTGVTATVRGTTGTATIVVIPEGSEEYCPNTNRACLVNLRAQDRTKFDSAMTKVDTSRAICKEALDKFRSMLALNRIYRGNPNIPDSASAPDINLHDAQTGGGTKPFAHFDEDYLGSSSLAGLGGLILHEMWHVLNYPHGRNEQPPYTTPPYNQQVSCVSN
jgi:hypothetical protein